MKTTDCRKANCAALKHDTDVTVRWISGFEADAHTQKKFEDWIKLFLDSLSISRLINDGNTQTESTQLQTVAKLKDYSFSFISMTAFVSIV